MIVATPDLLIVAVHRTGATPHEQPKPVSRYATSEWEKPLQHPLSVYDAFSRTQEVNA